MLDSETCEELEERASFRVRRAGIGEINGGKSRSSRRSDTGGRKRQGKQIGDDKKGV